MLWRLFYDFHYFINKLNWNTCMEKVSHRAHKDIMTSLPSIWLIQIILMYC